MALNYNGHVRVPKASWMRPSFIYLVLEHLTNELAQHIREEKKVHGVGEQVAGQGDGDGSLHLIACENLFLEYQCASHTNLVICPKLANALVTPKLEGCNRINIHKCAATWCPHGSF
jgi:hypothetical protein